MATRDHLNYICWLILLIIGDLIPEPLRSATEQHMEHGTSKRKIHDLAEFYKLSHEK